MKEKRVKITGQDTVGNWHFSDDVKFSRDEEIADLLANAKKETGNFLQSASASTRKAVKEKIDEIDVTYHKHNGRVQKFSVMVPKSLLEELREAHKKQTLLEKWCYESA